MTNAWKIMRAMLKNSVRVVEFWAVNFFAVSDLILFFFFISEWNLLYKYTKYRAERQILMYFATKFSVNNMSCILGDWY